MKIILRFFLPPPDLEKRFPMGVPQNLEVQAGITVRTLTEKLFGEEINRLGMIVVNGAIAGGNVVLAEGDRVDLYEILGGG